MALTYRDLTPSVRRKMVEEFDRDGQNYYRSKRLTGDGSTRWPELLRAALESGSDESLAEQLRSQGLLQANESTKKTSTKAVPWDAADTLSEGQFNHYYIRALCREAIEHGENEVMVYRAKAVGEEREQSRRLIGRSLPCQAVLAALQANPGIGDYEGLPGGANSTITVTRASAKGRSEEL